MLITQKHNWGFTLVEMMVVVSIISLLSSTVISTIRHVKVETDNATREKIVQEYKNTFDLLYSVDGKYPPVSGGFAICIGDYPADICNANLVEQPAVSAAIERFLPVRTPLKTIKYTAGGVSDGPTYGYACGPGATGCTYWMGWHLEGDVPCAYGITATTFSPNTEIGNRNFDGTATGCYLYLK